MTDTSDWRTKFRNRHRDLLVQLEARRSQHQARASEFSLPLTMATETATSRTSDSCTNELGLNNVDDSQRELGVDEIRQALEELYTECLERACEPEDTYEDKIRVLLSVFQYDIPSRIVADVVGCSCGHARRFEWDSATEEVREKAWSRKQREHQVPPALAEQVRCRDNYKCVRCSSDDELPVHHIDPAGQHGPAVMENLATLCDRCHKVAHGGNVSSGEVIYDSVEGFWIWTERYT